ncbi:MAG: SDR family oxidoreductase [Acidimicrobiales bacterium]
MSFTLDGKTALVTGAGRGIGRAIALELAAAGASVALLARSIDQLEEVHQLIGANGGRSIVVAADVGHFESVEHAARFVMGELGNVDVLINNAALVGPLGPTVSVPFDEIERSVAVNVLGPVALTRAVLPNMLGRHFGRIVNISSGVAEQPLAMIYANTYTMTKAALESHTANLAAELIGSGVTVNAYRPGRVDTAMQGWIRSRPIEEVGSALHNRFVEWHERGELITPEASARSLMERLSSEASGEIWSVELS